MPARAPRRSPRPSRETLAQAVLDALVAAYPDPVSPAELQLIAGRPYPSRIGELRDRGWLIETVYAGGPDASPSYRLRSPERGAPDPVQWGLRVRLGSSSGLHVTEYSTGTPLPPEVWTRVEARVQAVVEAELRSAGLVPGASEPDFLDVLAAYSDDEEGH